MNKNIISNKFLDAKSISERGGKIIASILLLSVTFSNLAFATTENNEVNDNKINKNETVYVIKEDGDIKDKIVSIWLNSEENINVKDNTILDEIKNLKTGEMLNKEDGYITINEESKDVYYQGKTDKELPIDVKLEYYLDGEKITNKELEGKTGNLKIVLTAENKKSVTKNVSGKETKIYSPYVAVSTMAFNDDNAKNIIAKDSKIIKDGKKEIVTTILTPGLKENFQNVLNKEQLENFKDGVGVEMDITDYKPIETYVIITNEIFQDRKNLEEIDTLRSNIAKLEDATAQLVDGSNKLSEAEGQLNQGINDLNNGTEKLSDGSRELYNKSELLEDAVNKSVEKLSASPKYIGKLASGSSKLDGGLGEVKSVTAKISEKLSNLNLNDIFVKIDEMKNGISKLAEGSNNLNAGMSEANKNVKALAEGNNAFNSKMREMNNGVQNITIPDLGALKSINVEKDLTNIASSTKAVGQSAADIQKTIAILSDEKYKDDENIQNAIKSLEKTKANLGKNAGNIGTSTNNLKNSLAPLKDAKVGVNELGKIKELQAGMNELAKASNNINGNMQKVPEGLSKLEEGSINLNNGISKLNEEIGNININQEEITKLSEFPSQFGKLDNAIGELKNGSNDLSDGLNKFKEETKDLNEISKLSTEGIIPLREGIKAMNNGINELLFGTVKLKDGSSKFNESMGTFASKMAEYKKEGIDKIDNKAKELFEITDVFDAMLDLAKDETSFAGTDDNFKTRYRIVEKIK